jgi:hypothetical protein
LPREYRKTRKRLMTALPHFIESAAFLLRRTRINTLEP